MAIRPYYNRHQITAGLYTSGEEYVYKDGSDYEGFYHVLPNGQAYTEYKPNDDSVEIFEKNFDASDNVIKYNNLVKDSVKTNKYVSPKMHMPDPDLNDYQQGHIFRYFVQKRTSPLVSIIEIDVNQFNSINRKNKKGINGFIWRGVEVKWVINGMRIHELNRRAVNSIDKEVFVGLNEFIDNYFKFAR